MGFEAGAAVLGDLFAGGAAADAGGMLAADYLGGATAAEAAAALGTTEAGAAGIMGSGLSSAAGGGVAADYLGGATAGEAGAALGTTPEAATGIMGSGLSGAAAPSISPGVSNLASSGTQGGSLGGSAPTSGAGTTSSGISSAAPAAGGSGMGAPATIDPLTGEPLSGAAPTPAAGAATGAQPGYLAKGAQALGLTTPTGNLVPGTLMTGASLGLNAASQIAGNKSLGNMQQKVASATGALQPAQTALLDQYNSGKLNASDAQGIQQWVTTSKAQIRQQYASAGMGNSTQAQQAEAAIDQQAQAMTAQALNNYLNEAMGVTGAMTGPYGTLASQQIQQDAALQAAAGNVFKSIGTQQANQGAPATMG